MGEDSCLDNLFWISVGFAGLVYCLNSYHTKRQEEIRAHSYDSDHIVEPVIELRDINNNGTQDILLNQGDQSCLLNYNSKGIPSCIEYDLVVSEGALCSPQNYNVGKGICLEDIAQVTIRKGDNYE